VLEQVVKLTTVVDDIPEGLNIDSQSVQSSVVQPNFQVHLRKVLHLAETRLTTTRVRTMY
jgi:hypothetical protein